MKNTNIKKTSLFAVTLAAIAVTGCMPEESLEDRGWELVFSDEFDGTTLDTSKWAYEVNCWGGGNEEAQCYVEDPDNVYVKNGKLNIKAIREEHTGAVYNADQSNYDPADTNTKPFTSGRLRTVSPFDYVEGAEPGFDFRHDWKYGRIEIRAKVPSGQGTWAAAWMLPTDYEFGGWAMSGEIDILEAVNIGAQSDHPDAAEGEAENRVYGTLHYGRAWPGNEYSGTAYTGVNPADDFHTYSIEWEEGAIRWFVDNVHYATQTSDGWYTHYVDENGEWQSSGSTAAPFNQKFHLILNLAMGGYWAGNVNETGIDESIDEALYQIDYVRVYQCEDDVTGVSCGRSRMEGMFEMVEGVEEPPLPVAADFSADPLVIFDDVMSGDWQMAKWDDADGGDEYSYVAPTGDEDGYLDLLFSETGVMYLYSNEGKVDDFSSYGGNYSFKMRWVDGDATGLKVGINDSDGAFAHVVLDQQYFGMKGADDWTTVTIPVVDMVMNASGFDLEKVNIAGKFEQVGGTDLNVQIKDITVSKGRIADLTIFEDTEDSNWAMWDCCAGSTPSVVTDSDSDYGQVAKFDINGGTVVGFNAKLAGNKLFNADEGATLEFDLKMASAPNDGPTDWLLKVEAKDGSAAEVNLSTSAEGHVPTLNTWQRYTFDLDTLAALGLNIEQIDLVMVFPAWGTGTGASFHIDNVKFYGGEEVANVSLDPTSGDMTVTTGTGTPAWFTYASSGNVLIEEVEASDSTYGEVLKFTYWWTDAVGGLSSNSSGATHDATANSTLEFDLMLISHTDNGDPGYKLKVEGAGGFAEVDLGDSVEGHTPAVDTWQHYTFNISDLDAAGLDITEIHTIMVYPTWGYGSTGAKFYLDNVEFKN